MLPHAFCQRYAELYEINDLILISTKRKLLLFYFLSSDCKS
ncbi:hypothetical protein PROVRUST_06422 [Providencia rustigianii DSM 4541]|uniref:Uncharacterized protein n=1 Tax=Providencia rustigianii DSM 4541 TaxID=500637 RepID=D1P2J7_9GAMM|nr:hypothetical protein PROVRUST_06422 [Providencia rustigianii DSM 4541]